MLDDPNPHLLPDQEGYMNGSDTPNPTYIDVSAGAMMKLRLQSMNQLKSLLPSMKPNGTSKNSNKNF